MPRVMEILHVVLHNSLYSPYLRVRLAPGRCRASMQSTGDASLRASGGPDITHGQLLIFPSRAWYRREHHPIANLRLPALLKWERHRRKHTSQEVDSVITPCYSEHSTRGLIASVEYSYNHRVTLHRGVDARFFCY